jgi:hypothetical protein
MTDRSGTTDPIDEAECIIRAGSGGEGLRAVATFLHALPSDAILTCTMMSGHRPTCWRWSWRREQIAEPTGTAATKPSTFVQWKGTDLCMDLNCECGCHSHTDSYFGYHAECPSCHAVYEMPTDLALVRVASAPRPGRIVVGE